MPYLCFFSPPSLLWSLSCLYFFSFSFTSFSHVTSLRVYAVLLPFLPSFLVHPYSFSVFPSLPSSRFLYIHISSAFHSFNFPPLLNSHASSLPLPQSDSNSSTSINFATSVLYFCHFYFWFLFLLILVSLPSFVLLLVFSLCVQSPAGGKNIMAVMSFSAWFSQWLMCQVTPSLLLLITYIIMVLSLTLAEEDVVHG